MSRLRGAHRDRSNATAMGAASTRCQLAGALETGELEKRRKKRRRKGCRWAVGFTLFSCSLLVILFLAGCGCLLTADSPGWQASPGTAAKPLIEGTQNKVAGVDLLVARPASADYDNDDDDANQIVSDYAEDIDAERAASASDAHDDYSDFGTYVIFDQPGNPDQAQPDTDLDLVSDGLPGAASDGKPGLSQTSGLPTHRGELSQVLFYAAAKSKVVSLAPLTSPGRLALSDASNSRPADRRQLNNRDNANNHDLAQTTRSARAPPAADKLPAAGLPIRRRRGHNERRKAGLNDELEDDDTKWLSKMNERLSALPVRPDHEPRPLKVEPEGNANMSAASVAAWPTDAADAPSTNNNNTAGPQAQSLNNHNVYYWRLIWFVLPLGATFGNLLVIMAVYLERSLQSVTNYFIVSLAFADLFVGLIVMPFAVYVLVNGVWELGDATCDIFVAVDVTCSTASILNLVAISIDRYRAVAHPITYSARSSSRRALLTILAAWFISCCVGAPVILGLNTTPERESTLCILYNSTFIFWSSLTSFYVPCIIMIGLYWRIFLAIRSRTKKAIRAGVGAGGSSNWHKKIGGGGGGGTGEITVAQANSHCSNQKSCPAALTMVPEAAALAGGTSAKPSGRPSFGPSITGSNRGSNATALSGQVGSNEQLVLDRLHALIVANQDQSLDANLDSFNIRFAVEQIAFRSCGCNTQIVAKPGPCDDGAAVTGDIVACSTSVKPRIDLANRAMSAGEPVETSRPRLAIICCQSRFISKLSEMEIFNISPRFIEGSMDAVDEGALELELALCMTLVGLKCSSNNDLHFLGSRSAGRLAWSTSGARFWFEMNEPGAMCDTKPDLARSSIVTPTFRIPEVCRLSSDKIDVSSLGFRMTPGVSRQAYSQGRLLLRLVCSTGRLQVGSEPAGSAGNDDRSRCGADKDSSGQQTASRCACCDTVLGLSPTRQTDEEPALLALVEPCGSQVARVTVIDPSSGKENHQSSELLFAYKPSPRGYNLQETHVMKLWIRYPTDGELYGGKLAGRHVSASASLCEICLSSCWLATFESSHLRAWAEKIDTEDNRFSDISRHYRHKTGCPRRKKTRGTTSTRSGQKDHDECSHLSRLLREERQSTIARLASMSASVAVQTVPISTEEPELAGSMNGQSSLASGATTFVRASKLESESQRKSRERASSCGANSRKSVCSAFERRASTADESSTTLGSRSSGASSISDGSSMSRSSSSDTSGYSEVERRRVKSNSCCCENSNCDSRAPAGSTHPALPPSGSDQGASTVPQSTSGRQCAGRWSMTDDHSHHSQSQVFDKKKTARKVCGKRVSTSVCKESTHPTGSEAAIRNRQSTIDQSGGAIQSATRNLRNQSLRLSRLIRGKREQVELKLGERAEQEVQDDLTSRATSTLPTTSYGTSHLHAAASSIASPGDEGVSSNTAGIVSSEGNQPVTSLADRDKSVGEQSSPAKVDTSRNRLQANLLLSAVAVVAQKPMTRICKLQEPSIKHNTARNDIVANNNHLESQSTSHRPGSRRRREKNAARRERKATKTLAIVLGIFLICWTPFFTCNIIDGICIQLSIDCRPGMMVNLITSWLGYINSCVNPIIYTIFNMEFRRAFKKILSTSFGCCKWPIR